MGSFCHFSSQSAASSRLHAPSAGRRVFEQRLHLFRNASEISSMRAPWPPASPVQSLVRLSFIIPVVLFN
jgi:hypothetical protein